MNLIRFTCAGTKKPLYFVLREIQLITEIQVITEIACPADAAHSTDGARSMIMVRTGNWFRVLESIEQVTQTLDAALSKGKTRVVEGSIF